MIKNKHVFIVGKDEQDRYRKVSSILDNVCKDRVSFVALEKLDTVFHAREMVETLARNDFVCINITDRSKRDKEIVSHLTKQNHIHTTDEQGYAVKSPMPMLIIESNSKDDLPRDDMRIQIIDLEKGE